MKVSSICVDVTEEGLFVWFDIVISVSLIPVFVIGGNDVGAVWVVITCDVVCIVSTVDGDEICMGDDDDIVDDDEGDDNMGCEVVDVGGGVVFIIVEVDVFTNSVEVEVVVDIFSVVEVCGSLSWVSVAFWSGNVSLSDELSVVLIRTSEWQFFTESSIPLKKLKL